MATDVLDKAQKLLNFIYEQTNGNIENEIESKKIEDNELYKSINIDSKKEYSKIKSYLIREGYIDEYQGEEGQVISLVSDGFDEVIKDFPNLKPVEDLHPSYHGNFFERLDENKDEVLRELNKIKEWERRIDDINNDVQLIKLKLERILPEIDDDEIQDRIRDVLNSPNLIAVFYNSLRLLSNPKTSEEIKRVFTSQDTMALPPPKI